jgi:hypothetical protein
MIKSACGWRARTWAVRFTKAACAAGGEIREGKHKPRVGYLQAATVTYAFTSVIYCYIYPLARPGMGSRSSKLSQRAYAPFTLACHIGVVMPCSTEGPLFTTTAWLGEPMVDVLRRSLPRVRPPRGIRLRCSEAATSGPSTPLHAT